jgi:exopolysaccharide biosynthesis polyprenyl glycosylphosphotransferase
VTEPTPTLSPLEAERHAPRAGTWVPVGDGAVVLQRRRAPWRDALLRRMLALADAATAFLVSISLVVFPGGAIDAAFWASVFLPVWILLAKFHGLYDADHRSLRHLTVDELPAILSWAVMGTAALGVFLAVGPAHAPDLASAARACAIAIGAAVCLRALARFLWRRLVPRERTLVLGSGPLAAATRRKLEIFPDIHAEVVDHQDEASVGELLSANGSVDVDRVILASHVVDETAIAQLVTFCRARGIKLSIVPPARGMFGTAVRLNHVADLPVVEYNTWEVSRSTLLLKRTIDIAIAAPALVALSPLFLLIAVAIVVESRGPILFVQLRAGLEGRPFRVYKFRTMVSNAEQELSKLVRFEELRDPMFKLRHDPRVTRVGRILRRFSLDELPQLWNVLRGDMSLVGPRPELLELVERWPREHHFRLSVKPGLTGPMQVFGRSQLSFEEWLAVERDYIENLSLGRDLRILAMTLPTVMTGRGAF